MNIRSTGFAPRTVTIAGGDTVQWKNVDTVDHQVVANNGSFASGRIAPNRTYSKRIDTPGTYGYRDALHPTLRGIVKVTGNPPSVSIGASTGIAVAGSQVHVGGAISPAAVGDTVTIWAQPFGQASFVKVADVQTTTNGVYGFSTSPQILTTYKATWRGKTSALINVAVSPRLTLSHVRSWFVARAQAPAKSFAGRFVYIQRLNRFGDWVQDQEGLPEPPGSQALQAHRSAERPEPRARLHDHQPGRRRLHVRYQPDTELPPPIAAVGDSREAAVGSRGLSAISSS